MSPVIDQLAELTGFRDRDMLDTTLVGALNDLLRPRELGVFRPIGDNGGQRWHTRAHMRAGDVATRADSVWADLGTLPSLDAFPERMQCLRGGEVLCADGDPAAAWFPIGAADGSGGAVLELLTDRPLSADAQRTVCAVLRVYRNVHALLDYSERDTLTGLLNRKTFDGNFLKSISELVHDRDTEGGRRRGREPAGHWLAVIDIDHFKRVNDTWGHLIGDEVLLLMSRLMRATFRYHDGLYRFGGEEFVVLMRAPGDAEALSAFERFRLHAEQYVFPQVGHITVSVGVTQVRPGDTPSTAFERADRAVYHAKGHGRNQVASHAALVASGHLGGDAKVGDIELF